MPEHVAICLDRLILGPRWALWRLVLDCGRGPLLRIVAHAHMPSALPQWTKQAESPAQISRPLSGSLGLSFFLRFFRAGAGSGELELGLLRAVPLDLLGALHIGTARLALATIFSAIYATLTRACAKCDASLASRDSAGSFGQDRTFRVTRVKLLLVVTAR
jgi:hypothetical protein